MTAQILQHTARVIAHDADQYGARVWLVAEALYHDEQPTGGRLIRRHATVRGRFLRRALKAVAALTDREGASWEPQRVQAAADYACHRDWSLRQRPERFYHASGEEA